MITAAQIDKDEAPKPGSMMQACQTCMPQSGFAGRDSDDSVDVHQHNYPGQRHIYPGQVHTLAGHVNEMDKFWMISNNYNYASARLFVLHAGTTRWAQSSLLPPSF